MEKREIIPILVIMSLVILSIYIYPTIPTDEHGMVPVHWGADGRPDGYGSKFMGVLFVPILAAFVYILLSAVPFVAVFKKNIRDFLPRYIWIKTSLVLFLAALHIAVLLQMYYPFNMMYFIMPALAMLFFIMGDLIRTVKRNYFIGIRTPWALANDKVWKKTHEMGSKVFKIIALVLLASLFFPTIAVWIILVSVLASIIYLFWYSYSVYKQ